MSSGVTVARSRNAVTSTFPLACCSTTRSLFLRGFATEAQSVPADTIPGPPPKPPLAQRASVPGTKEERSSSSKNASRVTSKRGTAFVRPHTPFRTTIEAMPYQTFQLALQIIKEDRNEKRIQIREGAIRIAGLKKRGLTEEDKQIIGIRKNIENLKILADINNPRIKFNFENGVSNPDRPIYRYLANKKWRKMRRPILMQRLEQMKVVPDVIPNIDPIVEVVVRFGGKEKHPGDYIASNITERPPSVKIIPFKEGEMLCTIVVVDPDVPNIETNSFDYRLHWLITNIPISLTNTQAVGKDPPATATTLSSYLPPHVQMGAPYHRYSMIVYEQSQPIDLKHRTQEEQDEYDKFVKENPDVYEKPRLRMKEVKRDGFKLRSFQDKYNLTPIGAFMWRGQWDATTKEVMERHNLLGWDIRYERNKP